MKKTIKVDYLARVEGEGALYLKTDGDRVEEVRLKIFEPPRFFESLLRGRSYLEAPDITSRICGICPVAYMMSAVHAVEAAAGIKVEPGIRQLRRLLYCGEWIESHVLHIAMLHAPDFLGYQDAMSMAKDHPQLVQSALQLKKLGNEIVALLGGREIHPINVRVGGFYKLPEKQSLAALREKLLPAREAAAGLLQAVSQFDFPEFDRDYEYVALKGDGEYPLNEGRIVSNCGLDIDVADYEKHFHEVHEEHSNALHSYLREKDSYFVGPMARFHHNFEQLPESIRESARQAGIGPDCRNPFRSIQVRAVETFFAFDEAIRVIENYEQPSAPCSEFELGKSVGCAATEAPRGLLYHRYEVGDDGLISLAKIVPPTSQNQRIIELDLADLVPQHLHLEDEKLQWMCEQAIRNYDPCISCATHFIKLEVERQ